MGYLQGPWLVGIHILQLCFLGFVSLPLCCSLLPLAWRRLCEDAVACAMPSSVTSSGEFSKVLRTLCQRELVDSCSKRCTDADTDMLECAQGHLHDPGAVTG